MTYNPQILSDVLAVRSLTWRQLAERVDLSLEQLRQELAAAEPRSALLDVIARELAIPPFAFYMAGLPNLGESIPDFRVTNPAPVAKQRQTIESIQVAEQIQRLARNLKGPGAVGLPNLQRHLSARQHQTFAETAREYFGISVDDQISSADARVFYTVCRKKIEDKGIFVLHDSFDADDGSGFCLADDRYPVIVINTKKQTRGRRLFTLIHELGHVLMHQSGISDPFMRNNTIEVTCNQFAASFLVPKAHVRTLLGNQDIPEEPSFEDVARAARRLKISQQATAIVLETYGIFGPGTAAGWLREVLKVGNPDYHEQGGGAGGPPPQEKVKLARYGFHFAKVFGRLLRTNRIDEIDLYRSTGLKPKYQKAYFDLAGAIRADQLQGLELADE